MTEIIEVSEQSTEPSQRAAFQVVTEAIKDITGKHGDHCGDFALLVNLLHTQTDSFVFLLDTTFRCSDMTPEEHNHELDLFLHVNAMMCANTAKALGVTAEQSDYIMSTMGLAHKKAVAVVQRAGAELH